MIATAYYDFISGSVSFERTTDKNSFLGADIKATYAGITVKASASDILAKGDGRLISAEVGGTIAGVTAKVSGAFNFGNDFHKTGVGSLIVTAEAAYAFDFVSVKAKVTVAPEHTQTTHSSRKQNSHSHGQELSSAEQILRRVLSHQRSLSSSNPSRSGNGISASSIRMVQIFILLSRQ